MPFRPAFSMLGCLLVRQTMIRLIGNAFVNRTHADLLKEGLLETLEFLEKGR